MSTFGPHTGTVTAMSDTDNPPKPANLLRRLAALFYDSLLLLAIWFITTATYLLPLTGGEAIQANTPC